MEGRLVGDQRVDRGRRFEANLIVKAIDSSGEHCK